MINKLLLNIFRLDFYQGAPGNQLTHEIRDK